MKAALAIRSDTGYRSGKLQPERLVTHRFALSEIMQAYDTFGNAADEGALKVVLTNRGLG